LIGGDEPRPDRVPGAEDAQADPRKFTHYLLDEAHVEGRAKARFFRRVGYDASNWVELRRTILARLPHVEGRYSKSNPHGGDLYSAAMRIEAPGGTIEVLTVWEVHPKRGTSFVTAYPL
jgi:hypothetical protein